jgi:S-formylglutathione hydrolase FrmB
MLHGLSGHYTNWTEKTKLAEYAAQYHLIIVTPEGGDGWYTDSETAPAEKYESYFMNELIPDVDARFRTVQTREGRAVAGLSMGGYGALKFGLKYPERFVFAASISGALDAALRTESNPGFAWDYVRPSVMKTFGPAGSKTRGANDLHRLFLTLPTERVELLPFFYLSGGTEDGFLASSRELASILLKRKIPHEFRQLPGKHDWAFWDAQGREVLKMAAEKMPYIIVVKTTQKAAAR